MSQPERAPDSALGRLYERQRSADPRTVFEITDVKAKEPLR